jgi:hypothetical protein
MKVRVVCYEGYRAEETPRAFLFGERRVEVVRILDRWRVDVPIGQGRLPEQVALHPWAPVPKIPQSFKRSILPSAARPEGLLFINLPIRFGR